MAAAVLVVMALLVAACSPQQLLNDVFVPSDGWTAVRDVAYGDAPRQQLDVYRPESARPPSGVAAAAPVAVFIYGGGWRSGERRYYRFVGEALTSRGWVAVIPDYRLYPQVRFPTFVEDAAAAVGWTVRNIASHGGDPTRIVLIGHSAGAHTAALLATDRRYLAEAGVPAHAIRALVGLSGPYGFDPFEFDYTRPVFAPAADAGQTQPLAFVRGGEPPMLLLHGADDRTVFPVNALAMADAARRVGGEAEALVLADTGHIDIILALARPFRRQDGILDRITAFVAPRVEAARLTAGRLPPPVPADGP